MAPAPFVPSLRRDSRPEFAALSLPRFVIAITKLSLVFARFYLRSPQMQSHSVGRLTTLRA